MSVLGGGVNLVAVLLFWDTGIFQEWVKYCGNSLLSDVKINESRHEEGVKVAGCSFRSLRRSNILVFTVLICASLQRDQVKNGLLLSI